MGLPLAAADHSVRVLDVADLLHEKLFTPNVSQVNRPRITTVAPLPAGTAGQPYALALVATGGAPPYNWEIATGALPLGLALNAATGAITGMPKVAGASDFTVLLRDSAGNADTESYRLRILGNPNLPPDLDFEPDSLITQFTRQPSRVDRQIRVINRGGGTLSYNVSAETTSGGNWLTVSPNRVDASPETPAVVSVSILPPAAGTADCRPTGCFLEGAITFQPLGGGPQERVRVLAGVSRRENLLTVAPVGLAFTGRAGGPPVPEQFVQVGNLGPGLLPWTAVATTLDTGGAWLKVDPESGSTGPNSGTDSFRVRIDPAGLAPGVYYGRIDVLPPPNSGAARLVTVIANIMPPEANVNPVVEPAGLVFTSSAGGPQPPTQPVFVFNPSSSSLTFEALLVAEVNGETAARSFPGLVVRAGERLQLDVASVFSPQLARGLYRGFMRLTFAGGFSETVSLALIVGPSGVISLKLPAPSQGACMPTALYPVVIRLPTASAQVPASVTVRVLDDCNNPIKDAYVIARFASGAETVLGLLIPDGTWLGTLPFAMPEPANSVTIDVNEGVPNALVGSVTRKFVVGEAVGFPPFVRREGVVGGANAAAQPLAPGGIFSVYATNLSNSQSGAPAPGLPLPTTLGGTRLYFSEGGYSPLMFSGILPGQGYDQVNAITPYALSGYTGDYLDFIAVRDDVQSAVPVPVGVREFQPGIFTQDTSGTGAGSIAHPDGRPVTPDNPAVAGEYIAIALTGLGVVTPEIDDGQPSCVPDGVCLLDGSNLVLRHTATLPTVTIGGVELPAEAVAFAGLFPSYAGLYQMNVLVPPGLPPGEQEIIVTIGGVPSRDKVYIYIK